MQQLLLSGSKAFFSSPVIRGSYISWVASRRSTCPLPDRLPQGAQVQSCRTIGKTKIALSSGRFLRLEAAARFTLEQA